MGLEELKAEWYKFRAGWVGKQTIPSLKLGFFCLYAIIIISFYVYHHAYVENHGDYVKYKIPELDVVHSSKCLSNYKDCEYDRLTGWNIGRLLVFAFCGCIMPDKYPTVLLFSSIMGLMSHSNKGSPRVLTNFSTNMVGYTIGSQTIGIYKYLAE